jgi:hypothetical protein
MHHIELGMRPSIVLCLVLGTMSLFGVSCLAQWPPYYQWCIIACMRQRGIAPCAKCLFLPMRWTLMSTSKGVQVGDLIDLIVVGNAGFVCTNSFFEQFFFVKL